jgi:hypothetical protein
MRQRFMLEAEAGGMHRRFMLEAEAGGMRQWFNVGSRTVKRQRYCGIFVFFC